MNSAATPGSFARPWIRRLPNAISLFRGLLVFPVVYYTVPAGGDHPAAALVFLGVAWASDILDGWLARRWDARSETGRILDPLADKLVVDGTAVALWVSGRLPGWLAVAVVVRDVAILCVGISMRRRLGRVPEADALGKVTLGVLVVTLAAYLLNLDEATAVLKWVAAAALAASAVSYGRRFVRKLRAHSSSGRVDM